MYMVCVPAYLRLHSVPNDSVICVAGVTVAVRPKKQAYKKKLLETLSSRVSPESTAKNQHRDRILPCTRGSTPSLQPAAFLTNQRLFSQSVKGAFGSKLPHGAFIIIH